jgi:hypothetical protein
MTLLRATASSRRSSCTATASSLRYAVLSLTVVRMAPVAWPVPAPTGP